MNTKLLVTVCGGQGFIVTQNGDRQTMHTVSREIADALMAREEVVAGLVEAAEPFAPRDEVLVRGMVLPFYSIEMRERLRAALAKFHGES